MHFHHTNPKWQMPKQCEVYLEKIQERGKTFIFHLHIFIFYLAVEDMQTSSILQQSFNQMQKSFYSDPQGNITLRKSS
jgi:hypothetical protein